MMFHLTNRSIKRILSDIEVIKVPDLETAYRILSQAVTDSRVAGLVTTIINSKRGLVTVRVLQKYIRDKLKVEVSRHSLLKIIKLDHGLRWGVVKS